MMLHVLIICCVLDCAGFVCGAIEMCLFAVKCVACRVSCVSFCVLRDVFCDLYLSVVCCCFYLLGCVFCVLYLSVLCLAI